ncbi:hypothetical protein JCGZ_03282 [Jatropha curcas]|uniref:Uncharacterized protein n=1 Tax=Jatropha curcas TaxID=180498 RepID=A0A067JCP9_JATCU|nr:hypothetical protein JCGZ_03282 [Jatropha curcas]
MYGSRMNHAEASVPVTSRPGKAIRRGWVERSSWLASRMAGQNCAGLVNLVWGIWLDPKRTIPLVIRVRRDSFWAQKSKGINIVLGYSISELPSPKV